MVLADWHQAQKEDPVLKQVRDLYGRKELEVMKITDDMQSELHHYLRQYSHLHLWGGVPYHKVDNLREGYNPMQLVLPLKYQEQVVRGCNSELRHLEQEHTMDLMRDHFYCPHMAVDVEQHIKLCH